jgi:AraC family cel operon transcriptional repressor
MPYIDMNCIYWKEICPHDERLHLANVRLPVGFVPDVHDHDFYEVFLIKAGRGAQLLPKQETVLQTGSLYFAGPGKRHGFRVIGRKPLEMINVAFDAYAAKAALPFCPRLAAMEKCSGPQAVSFSGIQQKRFEDLVSELAQGPRDLSDALFFLNGVERILRPTVEAAENPDLPEWLRNALALAVEPKNLAGGVPRLIALCARSAEHVSRSFRKHLETTPSRWLLAERLRYAGVLLQTTQQDIMQIALDCGFDSLSYFHRSFRVAFGTTPRRYRQKAGSLSGYA